MIFQRSLDTHKPPPFHYSDVIAVSLCIHSHSTIRFHPSTIVLLVRVALVAYIRTSTLHVPILTPVREVIEAASIAPTEAPGSVSVKDPVARVSEPWLAKPSIKDKIKDKIDAALSADDVTLTAKMYNLLLQYALKVATTTEKAYSRNSIKLCINLNICLEIC